MNKSIQRLILSNSNFWLLPSMLLLLLCAYGRPPLSVFAAVDDPAPAYNCELSDEELAAQAKPSEY